MRKPIQILIFPFYKEKKRYLYAIFKRRDLKFWQGISGGTEGKDREDGAQADKPRLFGEVSP